MSRTTDLKPAAQEKEPYEAPAVVFEEEMQALASSCADCDITSTKSSGGSCTIAPFNPCIAPFNS